MDLSMRKGRLFLFWGGMALSILGFVRPSIASPIPLLWFLMAIPTLIGAACLLPNRYRWTALVVVSLCSWASFVTVRQKLQDERTEKIRKMVAPLELPHIDIGATAPDINGSDLSGNAMSLKEHRGKVVLLVFWATWCGPCMGSIPHENELAERFAGRPFVLVGVNGNKSTAQALDAVEKHSIPWKSFWNGDGGSEGPITTEWGVQSWPTVYVIDHTGVIRHRELHGSSLDEPLERLIKEAEARR